jgi:hypothetical protein
MTEKVIIPYREDLLLIGTCTGQYIGNYTFFIVSAALATNYVQFSNYNYSGCCACRRRSALAEAGRVSDHTGGGGRKVPMTDTLSRLAEKHEKGTMSNKRAVYVSPNRNFRLKKQ